MATIRGIASELVAGSRAPYAAAWEMWEAAVHGISGGEGDQDHIWGLWLLWGALSDWIEIKPEETPLAEESIRRAAAEWLALPDEPNARTTFFSYWLYEELEMERPTE